ncbi:hypothetical protein AHAS_Ahas04G0194600 [Arachis hypogaea]
MGEEASSPWQPPAHPSPPPTPPYSEDSDAEPSSDDSDSELSFDDSDYKPSVLLSLHVPLLFFIIEDHKLKSSLIPEEILTFFMFGGHHSEADFAGPEINLQRFRLSTLMDVDLRDLIVSNLGCFIFQMSSNRPSYS